MPTKAPYKYNKFYFPGIISLVILPLLCVVYLFKDKMLPKYGVLKITTYNEKEVANTYSLPVDMKDINSYRKYYDVSFTGNPGHDAEEHARLKMLLKQLNTKVDMVNGIRVTLNTHAKYKDMVAVFDDSYQNDKRTTGIAMVNNKIFIYQPGTIKPSNFNIPPCGGIVHFLPSPQPLTFSQKIQQLYRFWPSAIVFVAMIGFAISRKRYYFTLKHFI